MIVKNQTVEIYWDNKAEFSIDPISKELDFEGYRLYRTKTGDDFNLNMINDANLISQWDVPGNNIGFNNGFNAIELTTPLIIEEDTFYYNYTLDNLLNGWQYLIILTSFDSGNEELNIENAYKLNLLVEDQLALELKTLYSLPSVYFKPIRTQLSLLNLKYGKLLNFKVELMKLTENPEKVDIVLQKSARVLYYPST